MVQFLCSSLKDAAGCCAVRFMVVFTNSDPDMSSSHLAALQPTTGRMRSFSLCDVMHGSYPGHVFSRYQIQEALSDERAMTATVLPYVTPSA